MDYTRISLEDGGPNPPTEEQKSEIKATLGISDTPKGKFDATAAPSVADDSDSGYVAGSLWVDTTASAVYFCADPTVGAAVWITTSVPASIMLTDTAQNITGDKTYSAASIFGASSTFTFNGASATTLKTSLSIQNVDNTADADKPVSTAQATAVGLKADNKLYNTTWASDDLVVGVVHKRVVALNYSPTWTFSNPGGSPNDGGEIEAYFYTDSFDRTATLPANVKRLDIAGTIDAVAAITFKADANHYVKFRYLGGEWFLTSTADV